MSTPAATVTSGPRWAALTIGGLALAVVGVAVLTKAGARRWSALTDHQERTLLALPETSAGHHRVDFSGFDRLPAPVAKYLKLVLRDGQRLVRAVRFSEQGRLRTAPQSGRWLRFHARQIVGPLSIGFIWDATINLAPALHLRLRDSYLNGEGLGQDQWQSVWEGTIADLQYEFAD